MTKQLMTGHFDNSDKNTFAQNTEKAAHYSLWPMAAH
jgi:hypothetical protein